MKNRIFAVLLVVMICITGLAAAESLSENETVTAYRWFVNSYRNVRTVKVTYYDGVYAYNHGNWDFTPFSASVPPEYFVKDSSGSLAVAPIVWDIADAMRVRLYGEDIGETALLYGQYCERIRGKNGKEGFSGVHEGIDFVSYKGAALHAILDGVVTRAGDSNGTIGIYNEEYDITLLYLHCERINVKRGQTVKAGDLIGMEGGKAIYTGYEIRGNYAALGLKHVSTSHYTHVELRQGRHTSSNVYRNTVLESDCPYEYMRIALNVQESGRQPITAAALIEAQRLREEAEAQAREEALAAVTPEPTPEPTPEITVIEEVPETTNSAYGFSEAASTLTPAPIIESTLPPTTL